MDGVNAALRWLWCYFGRALLLIFDDKAIKAVCTLVGLESFY